MCRAPLLKIDRQHQPQQLLPKSRSTKPRSPRSVRFVEYSTMQIIDRQPQRCSYTSAERKGFRDEASHDVRRFKKVLRKESLPAQDDLFKCVGIENLITPNGPRRVMENRRKHMKAILASQVACTAEELRLLSEMNSRPAVMRAYQLAAFHSTLGRSIVMLPF